MDTIRADCETSLKSEFQLVFQEQMFTLLIGDQFFAPDVIFKLAYYMCLSIVLTLVTTSVCLSLDADLLEWSPFFPSDGDLEIKHKVRNSR